MLLHMISELEATLAFEQFPSIGPKTFQQLLQKFKTASQAFNSTKNELSGCLKSKTDAFDTFRKTFSAKEILSYCQKEQITILTQSDEHYPVQLTKIPDPPICLYVKGDISVLAVPEDQLFGIVGTRNMTAYGKNVTQQLARQLTEAGFILISGMARGIDGVAHWAGVTAGGKTIAVLGCGVDIPYPKENISLYHKIVNTAGIVISEFSPGTISMPGMFVSRNRIISGLSKGVLVVEGSLTSGAMITAKSALEQGKEVFAVPCPISSSVSSGPNYLIKQGAILVQTIEDITSEFKSMEHVSPHLSQQLNTTELKIVETLSRESLDIDTLSQQLNFTIIELLPMLTSLEINNVVKKGLDNRYFV